METIWQDLRYGVRMLVKNPGFTLVAVITLALGIGANTAVFTIVNAVLLRPLPYADQERFIAIYNNTKEKEAEGRIPLSYPDFVDYRSQARTLEYIAAYNTNGASITSDGEPERVDGVLASSDLFPLLGVKPALGRVFSAEEDRKGAPLVIVLSNELWQRRFSSVGSVVGRQIILDGRNITVIGVMPTGFKFPLESGKIDFWMPLASDPGLAKDLESRGSSFLSAIAKLKPNVTIEQAHADLNLVAERLEKQYPDSDTGVRVQLVSVLEDIVGNVRRALQILLGAVGFILLIACANIVNLLLVRTATRGKEIAIRTALGASRARVIRQLLTESLLLSLAGGVLGLLIGQWSVYLLAAASPGEIPRFSDIGLDSRVFVFTFAITLIAGAIFGAAPAFGASRPNLNESLKEGGKSSASGAYRNRKRGLLVISEIALSLVLLIGAGLLIRSFWRLRRIDPGYNTSNILAVNIALSEMKYPERDRRARFFEQALERIKGLPGVEVAAATNLLPLSREDRLSTFEIEGHEPFSSGEEPHARDQVVSPDYFRALNIPLRTGRDFSAQDTKTSAPVVIINEDFARLFFPNEDPLGKHILIDGENQISREIVGVVGNVLHRKLDGAFYPAYYEPYLQRPARRMDLIVHSTSANAAGLASLIRGAIKEVDKEQVIWETRTMADLRARSVATRRFNMIMLGVFAGLALLLAAVGIYGVMSYSVTQRTQEIGLRLALGAQMRDVIRLVLESGMRLALIGISVGVASALALTQLMSTMLFEVQPHDALTFVVVTVGLVGVALLACYIPARRATKVDPLVALRYE